MTVSMPTVRPARAGRFLLVARYYSIEPLGILYLAGKIRDMGWECNVVLVHEFDFSPVYEEVRLWKPDIVGVQIWTGYHSQAFKACDVVRTMGVPVAIGGPHATYAHTGECLKHADWVLQGMGFKQFGDLLEGKLAKGQSYFDLDGREDPFPLPDREVVYQKYPGLAHSPIKSLFASVGCPFHCSYCYAPAFNEMNGGFKFITGSVNRLIAEAHDILKHRPFKLGYMQDDIFGFEYKHWLPEFAPRWRTEVGVPLHIQLRLELVQGDAGKRRLDLFQEAGVTGVTLAIESGTAFLRDRVLMRHMPHKLIVEGCRAIMERGLTLRTEQILAVPFSSSDTDLSTLALNHEINPTMAWTSILAPYLGTSMGTIAKNFGFYDKNNDDLADSFFDSSVLRHPAGGMRDIEPIVEGLGVHPKALPDTQPLPNMWAVKSAGEMADVMYQKVKRQKVGTEVKTLPDGAPAKVGTIEYLGEKENGRYCEEVVRLQRLFIFLAKAPESEVLGRKLLALRHDEWSWARIGTETTNHLRQHVSPQTLEGRRHALAREMGYSSPQELPEPIKVNPQYFCYFPAGGELAKHALKQQVFDQPSTASMLDELNTLTRRHLFHYGLYKIEKGADPIAA